MPVPDEILDHARCTKLPVLNVDRNVKFHSSRKKADRFTAKDATQKREIPDSLSIAV
jgi:hypothetical protein